MGEKSGKNQRLLNGSFKRRPLTSVMLQAVRVMSEVDGTRQEQLGERAAVPAGAKAASARFASLCPLPAALITKEGYTMKMIQSARRAALAIGVAGAAFMSFAGGPAFAGHGYMMKEHPLRGHFPLASGEAPAASNAAAADAKGRAPDSPPADVTTPGRVPARAAPPRVSVREADRRRPDRRGDWLRGDFPRAAAAHPNPVQATQVADGVERTSALHIPGSTRLRIEELTFQAGAAVAPFTMQTAFICEMVRGELETIVDVAPVKRRLGDVWPCPTEQVSALHTNTGTTPAVMRVFHRISQ